MDTNNSGSDKPSTPYVASAGNSPFVNNPSKDSGNSDISTTPRQTQSQQSSSEVPMSGNVEPASQSSYVPSTDPSLPTTQPNAGTSEPSSLNPNPTMPQAADPTMPQAADPTMPQAADPTMPQAADVTNQPAMNPQEATPLTPSEPNRMNKKRILLFVVLFLIVVVGATVGYYMLTQRSTTSTSNSEDEQGQLVEATPTPESVSYPTTDLISQITGLLQQENYTFDGIETTVSASGCNYLEGMQVVNNNDNFSVVFSTSLIEETDQEVCAFEGVVVENLELYSIDGTNSFREESTNEFEEIGSEDIPEKMVPQSIVNSVIPYPTLLTVADAYKADEEMTEVEAQFVTNEQEGTYTFTVTKDGLITSIVYELVTESGTYTSTGEIIVDYTAETIILPTSLSTPS